MISARSLGSLDVYRQHQGRGEGARKGARADPRFEDLRHRRQDQYRDASRDLTASPRQRNGTCWRRSSGTQYSESLFMQIAVGYELIYDCPQPTPMIQMLNVHHSRVADLA